MRALLLLLLLLAYVWLHKQVMSSVGVRGSHAPRGCCCRYSLVLLLLLLA